MNRRILFYINAINGGGAERVIIQLAKHFSADGYECRLLTSFRDEEFEYDIPDEIRRDSIENKEIRDGRLKKNIRRIKELRNYCKEFEPAILVSFMAEPNFRAIIATRGIKTKCLISVRNDPDREYSGFLRPVGKWILPFSDGCVFQTELAQKWFSKRLQKKSKVILNEVSHDFFNIVRDDTSKDIIAIGRLYEQKNYFMLIEAFSLIEDKTNENLMIYGDGYQRGEIEKYIVNKGLVNRVFLMGQTSDIISVLKKAKIYVLSSDYEGLPNALMEALAAGVPSISTDCPCGGPAMLIENGVSGYLCEVNNPRILSEKMLKLLLDDNLQRQFSNEAKMRAQKMFSPEKIYFEWKNYIENVISG